MKSAPSWGDVWSIRGPPLGCRWQDPLNHLTYVASTAGEARVPRVSRVVLLKVGLATPKQKLKHAPPPLPSAGHYRLS